MGEGINTYYRPVLEILYRLQYWLFGPHPFGFHLFNVIVHIINGLLLLRLLGKLSFAFPLAWLVSLLFLIHPVQTEAVSCIAGISNLWMALGVLIALNAYVDKKYWLSWLFFVIAFLSKEQALVFVPLVMVIDYYRGQKNIRSWVVVVLTAFLLLWMRQQVTGASLVKDIMASPGELLLRLAAIPRVLGIDLRLIFFPYDLHYYRSTDILQPNTVAWVIFFIVLGGLGYMLMRWPQVRKILVLGLGWFIASLLPVLNIAPLINEYSFILTAEHFLYLPVIGILILVVVAADRCIKNNRRLLLGGVISGCLFLTWYQNAFWQSEIVLFKRMLRFEPDFGRGHLLLAKAYFFNRQHDQADGHFKKAFDIMVGYEKKSSNATAGKFYRDLQQEILFDWSQNDAMRGKWPQSLEKLKQGAAIDGGNASIYNNMAVIYLNGGDLTKARFNFAEALRLDPSFMQAKRNLDIVKDMLTKPQGADDGLGATGKTEI